MIVAEGAPGAMDVLLAARASMGPQLDSCGREVQDVEPGALIALQWGRNLIVAEGTPTGRRFGLVCLSLQWGRNLIVAEGVHDVRLVVLDGGASMGPQLDSCGRSIW